MPDTDQVREKSRLKPSLYPLQCDLTPREWEIVQLLSQGLSTGMIAQQLYISEHTVATHRKLMIRKLEVSNTVELVAKCIRSGWL